MSEKITAEVQEIMDQRFGCDRLISIATAVNNKPYIRAVNAYYEDGSFYFVTHAKSSKMTQIAVNPLVAVCGEWFTGHGTAENLGYVLADSNAEIMDKLRCVFAEWYDNGHVDERDPDMIVLRIKMLEGVLHKDGKRYDIEF
ncbi:MAG: pyridoxamine 5'-phosphate oxidase family protein [Oscillospiraceae bacterium]|nr:pyridoxamine 5'-phosphate oxidase family protein [Oscillospiraceae bacterium]